VMDYKQVVTHYFACKSETWLANFLTPVYGLEHNLCVYENAKGRGAIHAHNASTTKSKIDKLLNAALTKWAQEISQGMEIVNDFIDSKKQEIDPEAPVVTREDMEVFLNKTEEGKAVLKDFCGKEKLLKEKATEMISETLQSTIGMTANHPGIAPSEWVKPGGTKASNYRTIPDEMQSKKDVLNAGEIRHFKFQRETDLHCRNVNLTNHCLCHSCSAYCLREKKITVDYDPLIHTEDNKNVLKRWTSQFDGTERVLLLILECRMGFGIYLRYPLCGDRTGGALRLDRAAVELDANQVPKYHAERNHPRTVQGPLASRN